VSLASKLDSHSRIEIASTAFYAVTGIILLVFLFLSGFPPHLGLLGALSLVVAYGIFTDRKWTAWINFILFIGSTTFSAYTLASIGFSNVIVALEMIVYLVLTWVFAYYNLLKKINPSSS
jgi:hypothetical protein